MSGARVTAYLGMDVGGFEKGLTKAEADVGRFWSKMRTSNASNKFFGLPAGGAGGAAGGGGHGGDLSGQAEGRLHRMFGLGHAIKGLFAGLGFAGVDKVVEKLTSYWEHAAEKAKEILEFSERTTKATLELIELRRTDPQRMALLKAEEKSLQKKLGPGGTQYDNEEEAVRGRYELQARLAENALAQGKLREKLVAKIEADAAKKAAEKRGVEQEIQNERKKHLIESLSLEQQLAREEGRQLQLQQYRSVTMDGTLEQSRLTLSIEQSITEQNRLQVEIAAESQKAWDRALNEEAARQRELNDLTNQRAAAEKRLQSAQQSFATSKRDALAPTLDELTRTPSGRRDTTKAGLAAQRILEDEAHAKRLFRSGDQQGAAFYQNRALAARGAMGDTLKSGESQPFASAEKDLSDASAELKEAATALKAALQPVAVDED